jgi:uncharacterized protein YbjT (DUF2867 family)
MDPKAKEDAMYVVTGATGRTGSVVARRLLGKGERVRVIGRGAERLKNLAAEGGEPSRADLSDVAGLTKAFLGAKAVYVMLPPNPSSHDCRAFQNRVTHAITAALRDAGVRHAVTLSSIGADQGDKTGSVAGLHDLEQQLNRIEGLSVLHLRAGYFMENTLAEIANIQTMGKAAGPFRPDLKLPMIATRDIGKAAADALLSLNLDQTEARELQGQRDLSMSEVAQIIGRAIGMPDLRYVQASDEQVRTALLQLGISANMADLILEMSAAWNSGHIRAIEPRSAANSTSTSYETFVAEEFLPRFLAKSAAA